MNELDPPPGTITEFVYQWRNWLNNLYEWLKSNVSKDFYLEVSKGAINGHSHVNKYGCAPDGIQTTATDIWDRADATPTQQIWVAPTQARIHDIVSTSTNDDGNPVGTGLRTVQVYGLTSWDSKETSELITMNGTTNVPTVNSYVIIHRMKALTYGASGPNVGIITATAQTDATVTAQINIGQGQTQMAIYGIPSIQKAYLTIWDYSIHKASGAVAHAVFNVMYNPDPENQIPFIVKEVRGAQSNGDGNASNQRRPYKKFDGPGIIKVQATASSADLEGDASFDLILVDN